MKTRTQKHLLRQDTVPLALTLKTLERRPNSNLLREWMAARIREELEWRKEAALRAVW